MDNETNKNGSATGDVRTEVREEPNVSLKWNQPAVELNRGPYRIKHNVPALKIDGVDVMRRLRLSLCFGIVSFVLGCGAVVLILWK